MEKIIFILITAFLGAYAGKARTQLFWRRLLIPLLAALYAISKHLTVASLAPLLWAIPLSMGYGLPDENDSGSFLGRLAVRISRRYADAIVRGIIAVLLSIPLFILAGAQALLPAFILIIVWALFGGDAIIKGEGLVAGLLVEDLILYGALGLSLVLAL